ncbi:hypothetical protein AOQ84DRAFT_369284 [Glonium stellatum]|uniref:Uncharacterized protein n=1 Tax=Glonium stellatum TaxID=574774 RepID=A0A8E2JMC2_9PEZI|nr:hypothetical protein AOQ84DRAFT_369284 [Glonium stellatum]
MHEPLLSISFRDQLRGQRSAMARQQRTGSVASSTVQVLRGAAMRRRGTCGAAADRLSVCPAVRRRNASRLWHGGHGNAKAADCSRSSESQASENRRSAWSLSGHSASDLSPVTQLASLQQVLATHPHGDSHPTLRSPARRPVSMYQQTSSPQRHGRLVVAGGRWWSLVAGVTTSPTMHARLVSLCKARALTPGLSIAVDCCCCCCYCYCYCYCYCRAAAVSRACTVQHLRSSTASRRERRLLETYCNPGPGRARREGRHGPPPLARASPALPGSGWKSISKVLVPHLCTRANAPGITVRNITFVISHHLCLLHPHDAREPRCSRLGPLNPLRCASPQRPPCQVSVQSAIG